MDNQEKVLEDYRDKMSQMESKFNKQEQELKELKAIISSIIAAK
jgi:hypothetical protein